MQEWISQILQSPTLSLAVLAAAFLLGLVGSVSSCCNWAVIGAIAGYSGSLSERKKGPEILLVGFSFMLGTIIALGILGAVTGFISQTVGTSLGTYWRLFAGLALVLFGLASLNFLPFKFPRISATTGFVPQGSAKAMVFGLTVRGGTTACSACCNPVLPVALGVVTLQGQTLWGVAILAAFAVGYSLPLAAAIIGLGLGFGKLTSAMQKLAPAVKIAAGVLLIGTGFYLLVTV